MGLNQRTAKEIRNLLVRIVKQKLIKYNPETKHMPFHHRLLGRDRYATFSFIHSMNTTLGMSVWEQIAVILAESSGNTAKRQYRLQGEIDKKTEGVISEIHLGLRRGEISANKDRENELIRKSVMKGKPMKDPDSTVDLYVIINGQENYIDITSAKLNMKEFSILKHKLLRWTGLRLSVDNDTNVITRLAIPYNPYYPKPYERWTSSGLFDSKAREILVGKEFWNTIAQKNVYEDLLGVFQEVGEQLKPMVDRKIVELQRRN